ncbi:MAG TPA: GNAT family N-acetyltransferase [Marinagarivorans sp.]
MPGSDWDGVCFDLRDQPSLIDTLLLWLHAEWLKQRKSRIENPAHAYAKRKMQLQEHLKGDAIPMTLVAKECASLNAPPLGCVSLTRLASRNSRFAQGLWLSNLFVTPTARGRGIGETLLKQAELAAWRLGEKELYLYTDSSRGYYTARGWQECLLGGAGEFVGSAEKRQARIAVFKKPVQLSTF